MATRNLKSEARILGVDDGPFNKLKDKDVLIVATVFRGGLYPDAVLSSKVKIDGDDATIKLVELFNKCRQKRQLHAIMLKGIAFGGFNVIDIKRLATLTKKPVIVIIRDYPDFKKIKNALTKRVKDGDKKLRLLEKAGRPVKIKIKGKSLYMQFANVTQKRALELIQLTSTRSFIPEPIRLAHMVAAGIVLGRSRGRV